MPDLPAASLAVAIASLVIVAVLCHPALILTLKRFLGKKTKFFELSDRYEDEDGVATEESEAAYSDFIQRLILILVSAVGSLDALGLAVIATSHASHRKVSVGQWLQFAAWMPILLQAIVIFITPSSRARYRLGVLSAASSLTIFIALAVEAVLLRPVEDLNISRNRYLTLGIVQWLSALILTFTSVLIPRRPDVYYKEKVVDRENTASVLSKFTFSWPTAILTYAVKNRGLNHDDLPQISHELRSRDLRANFESVGKKDRLWKSLFWSRKWYFIKQWSLQAACSITNFLPQIALLYILRTLEARDQGHSDPLKAWLLVAGLAIADILSTWAESYMFFISFMKVGVPIYEQLSAVVFGKAIRRKDIKGISKTGDSETAANGDVKVNKGSGVKGEDTAVGDDAEDEDVQKTRQSTINLVGVDSKRISDFAMFNYIFLGSAIKFIFAVGFLVRLIGWIPMLAGFIAPAIITPLNVYTARKYAAAQDDLMKYRDQKMAVVTEALQGIRQIKFSALERDWYEKILQTRRKELKTQWAVFVCDTCLISIWIFGPVMLSAISLTTYALINKELSASIAFTTISVFEAIEMTLAVIPEMVTELLDCMVSAKRIQDFLDSPEREDTLKPGQTVTFREATIAWPSDAPEQDEDQFCLRKINLSFPRNELSVISGRTGSGKSLLLSSIIGEAEVLEGAIHVPKAPLEEERYDAKANPKDWIIPSSVAYVAQIPWIENATIRDNILFGLPMDYDRYKKVLGGCALEKDLEMLEDGELTDIGANGINLSGGQKWRVSFARALYSRAGILVLDDIFSAVDANVGRHLYEQALTGELGQGRTRILVTHHVALCLPKTKYSVLLANGEIEEAGATEDLQHSGKLKSILAVDVEEQKREDDETGKPATLAIDDGGGLQKMMTNQSRRTRRESALSARQPELNRRRSHATLDDNKTAPKKFTEEEGRETGAIKWTIYAQYIRAGGGFMYWGLIAFVFGIWIAVYLARSYWISVWTRSYHTEATVGARLVQQPARLVHHLKSEFSDVQLDSDLAYYLSVYLGISLMAWLVGTVRYFTVFVASIRASKVLFENLAFAILRAPLRWLDTTPTVRPLSFLVIQTC